MANPRASANMAPGGVKRAGDTFRTWMTVGLSMIAGFALAIVPPVAAATSHIIERIGNHFKAKKEFEARADWYREQIAATLGMNPRKVRAKHLVQAAAINPVLAAAVKDVEREQSGDNKSSAMINTAVAFIPFGNVVKEGVGVVKAATMGAKAMAHAAHMGKTLAVTTGAGLLASWTTTEHLSAQEVIEGINGQLEAAEAQGIDPKAAIHPAMLFTLRIAQDEKLGKEIEHNFGKPFNKLDEAKQLQVMQTYPALANATAAEAHAIANRMLPVQELMARAPNLNGTAKYVMGSNAATFAGRVQSQRNVAGTNITSIPRQAANDARYVAAEEQRRLAATGQLNNR